MSWLLIDSIFIPTEVLMVLTKPGKMNCFVESPLQGSEARFKRAVCWPTHESAQIPRVLKMEAWCETTHLEAKRNGPWTRGRAGAAKRGRRAFHSTYDERAAGNHKARDGGAVRRARPGPYPWRTEAWFPDSPSPRLILHHQLLHQAKLSRPTKPFISSSFTPMTMRQNRQSYNQLQVSKWEGLKFINVYQKALRST